MKTGDENSKWKTEIRQLLTSLEKEINQASQKYPLLEIENKIKNKYFREQLIEIDILLLDWIIDLKFWEKNHHAEH